MRVLQAAVQRQAPQTQNHAIFTVALEESSRRFSQPVSANAYLWKFSAPPNSSSHPSFWSLTNLRLQIAPLRSCPHVLVSVVPGYGEPLHRSDRVVAGSLPKRSNRRGNTSPWIRPLARERLGSTRFVGSHTICWDDSCSCTAEVGTKYGQFTAIEGAQKGAEIGRAVDGSAFVVRWFENRDRRVLFFR